MAKSSYLRELMNKYKGGTRMPVGMPMRTMAVGIGEEGGGRPSPDYSQLKTAAEGPKENGGGAWQPLNPQTKPTPRRKDSKYGDQSPFFKGNLPPPPSMRTPPGSQQMPGADNPRRPMPGFAPPKAPPGGPQMKTMAMIASEMGGGMPGPIQSQGPGTGLAPGGQQSMTMAIPESGGGQPGPIQSQGPGTGLAPGGQNRQIDLSQLMQPPRDRSQIIEDRVREQTIMDSPPGSPQRKHLEAGGKVTDMPKPDGTPERDVQPGGYPIGGPTRDGSPGFLEPDPKNPYGSKQAEVKHNIEVERQKEAELGNKPTADIAPGMEKYADKHKPNSTQTQAVQQPPSVNVEPKQKPTETDTPGPVKTEQPTPAVDTTPTDTRTTPQQRDAAQKFKDKRQEQITGKKSMPFG